MVRSPLWRGAGRAAGAALVAAVLVPLGALAPAHAASPPVQVGLFGAADPTYDGVFRQSLALLAYVAADRTPPSDAVDWLLHQQCADGGFQSYRQDVHHACTPSDPVRFTGEDTNSTGLAAAALGALGRHDAAGRAAAWLTAAQGSDGGWSFYVGSGSDTNSTADVLLGLRGAGVDPATVSRGGHTGTDYLATMQLGCAAAGSGADGSFAFASFSPDVRNDKATVQVVTALSGRALPVAPGPLSAEEPRRTCPAGTPADTSARLGAGYVARELATFHGAIPQPDFSTGDPKPGTVDLGDTAWAVLALAANGVGRDQVAAAVDTLTTGTAAAKAAGARSSGVRVASTAATDDPGLLGATALALAATGGDAGSLVDRIGATMRTAPTAAPTPTPSASPSPTSSGGSDALLPTGATPLTGPTAVIGFALLLLGSGSVVLSYRRRPVR